jgi:hypothetical protein
MQNQINFNKMSPQMQTMAQQQATPMLLKNPSSSNHQMTTMTFGCGHPPDLMIDRREMITAKGKSVVRHTHISLCQQLRSSNVGAVLGFKRHPYRARDADAWKGKRKRVLPIPEVPVI